MCSWRFLREPAWYGHPDNTGTMACPLMVFVLTGFHWISKLKGVTEMRNKTNKTCNYVDLGLDTNIPKNALKVYPEILNFFWKHTSAIVCDPDDRRRSQTIEPCSIFCDRPRSFAIVCDQLWSCDHMENKVLRSAIETYPIIFWIPTRDSTQQRNCLLAYLKTWLALSKVTLTTRNLQRKLIWVRLTLWRFRKQKQNG